MSTPSPLPLTLNPFQIGTNRYDHEVPNDLPRHDPSSHRRNNRRPGESKEYADVGQPLPRKQDPVHIDSRDLIKEDMINANEDNNDECPIRKDSIPSPDIQMLDVYRQLAFDNPDGGVWKQGWNIEYDAKHWNSHHKLKVRTYVCR